MCRDVSRPPIAVAHLEKTVPDLQRAALSLGARAQQIWVATGAGRGELRQPSAVSAARAGG
jgi:hypothetical protein